MNRRGRSSRIDTTEAIIAASKSRVVLDAIPKNYSDKLDNWPTECIRPTSCGCYVTSESWHSQDECDLETTDRVRAECRRLALLVRNNSITSFSTLIGQLPIESIFGLHYLRRVLALSSAPIAVRQVSEFGLLEIVEPPRNSTLWHVMPTTVEHWPTDQSERKRWAERVASIVRPGTHVTLNFTPWHGLARAYLPNVGQFLMANVILPDGRDLGQMLANQIT